MGASTPRTGACRRSAPLLEPPRPILPDLIEPGGRNRAASRERDEELGLKQSCLTLFAPAHTTPRGALRLCPRSPASSGRASGLVLPDSGTWSFWGSSAPPVIKSETFSSTFTNEERCRDALCSRTHGALDGGMMAGGRGRGHEWMVV